VTGEELNAIIEALRQSGNAKIGKIFIFAGSRTLSEPLGKNPELQDAVVRTENLEPDVQFLANPEQFQARFEGNSVHPYVVRIVQTGEVGRAHYVVSDDDGATWSREMTLLPTIEVVNEDGQANDKVTMTLTGNEADKLGEPRIYPAGLEFRYEPSPPVVYLGNDDKRRIPTSEGHLQSINSTAREIFFRNEDDPNSLNVFDLLYSLKRALEDNDPVPLHDRLADLDAAFEQVLNRRADIGAARKELEDQLAKVQDREFTSTRQLSELEDLNFPAAVMEMNLADVRNRASLDTSARMVQPSLLNFLR
jgi:flagellin-like hook-associated protein FlgL